MRPPRRLAALLAGAVLVLPGCSSSNASDGTFTFHDAQQVGSLIAAGARKPVHGFSGSGLNGGTFRLSNDVGKVTIVNFWGSWCGPCQVETPQFGAVYDAYRARGVAFVGIDVKEGSRSKPRAFVKDNDIHYPIVYDEDGETAIRMGNVPTQQVPFTIALDKHHRVAAVYIARLAPKDLEPVLDRLLAEK
jgi:thiol-disulfide isomerase/thioredoxin